MMDASEIFQFLTSYLLFKGALDQVKIFRDPNMAADQCKTDFQVIV